MYWVIYHLDESLLQSYTPKNISNISGTLMQQYQKTIVTIYSYNAGTEI